MRMVPGNLLRLAMVAVILLTLLPGGAVVCFGDAGHRAIEMPHDEQGCQHAEPTVPDAHPNVGPTRHSDCNDVPLLAQVPVNLTQRSSVQPTAVSVCVLVQTAAIPFNPAAQAKQSITPVAIARSHCLRSVVRLI